MLHNKETGTSASKEKTPNKERPKQYDETISSMNTNGLTYPVPIKQIPKFEKNNNISINVYTMGANETAIRPLYITKNPQIGIINLLLLYSEENDNTHYVYISSMSALMNDGQRGHAFTYCEYCLTRFRVDRNGENRKKDHREHCIRNEPTRIKYPSVNNRNLKFRKISALIENPVVLYADFECYLNPLTKSQGNVTISSEHIVSGYCIRPILKYGLEKTRMGKIMGSEIFYTGPDAVKHFFSSIVKLGLYMEDLMKEEGTKKKQLDKKSEEYKEYLRARYCHICEDEITNTMKLVDFVKMDKPEDYEEDYVTEKEEEETPRTREEELWLLGPKVYDHCHMTGNYRGAAHAVCNLQLRVRKTIPIFFHNLTSYDSHFIIQELHNIPEIEDITITGKTLEKFVNFKVKVFESEFKLDFKDSLNFLTSSLENLVKNLKSKCDFMTSKGEEDTTSKYFPNTKLLFKGLASGKFKDDDFNLLLRKGVFPYTYISSLETLQEEKLPSIDHFFNDLTQEHIDESDYVHAKKVWDTFNCSTMKDYQELYMRLDVSLLCDVFENFRRNSMQYYGLDPTHFCTAPSLSWDACLKKTKVNLQLVTDPDISLFIDEGLLGGVSMARNPHLSANNEELPDYDATEEKTWLLLVDCNNQYGWAMSQPLPTGGFSWVEDTSKFTAQFISNLRDDETIGFYLEVDLEYPKQLHSKHDQYPLAPEHISITSKMLSSDQIEMAEKLDVKIGGGKKKLCLTLLPKIRYKCHYRNLRQYISLGMVLTKVHRVLQFQQSPWVKEYIDLNTSLRQQATCKADEVKNSLTFSMLHFILYY